MSLLEKLAEKILALDPSQDYYTKDRYVMSPSNPPGFYDDEDYDDSFFFDESVREEYLEDISHAPGDKPFEEGELEEFSVDPTVHEWGTTPIEETFKDEDLEQQTWLEQEETEDSEDYMLSDDYYGELDARVNRLAKKLLAMEEDIPLETLFRMEEEEGKESSIHRVAFILWAEKQKLWEKPLEEIKKRLEDLISSLPEEYKEQAAKQVTQRLTEWGYI